MIKVLIAEDHTIVREGLRQILQDTSDIVVADEASSGAETLEKVWKDNYDVVLLDISMPCGSGLDIMTQLRRAKPTLSVLILSMHPEERYAVRALKTGASGYLTKASAPDELIKAIRKVATGGKYVSSSLAEALAYYLENDTEKPLHERLSNREFQVMLLIASGKTVTEIAKELSLGVTTVSTYRSKILAKMKMKNNAEITYYAIRRRLVE